MRNDITSCEMEFADWRKKLKKKKNIEEETEKQSVWSEEVSL